MSNKKTNTESTANTANPRGRRRKARLENHPDVVKWCESFVKMTEDTHGFTPSQEQAIQAFLVAALKALDGR